MKKLRLKLITALVVSVSVLLMYHNAVAEIRTIKINVPACRCADTWATLRITVQRIDGVKAVLENPITQSAIITFDDEKTSYDQIKDTLIRNRVYIVGEPEYLK